MKGNAMDKVKLVRPDEATGEVAEIFEDIKRTKGERYLTPTWGFWALDPELLRHWWGLTKRLQMTPGEVSKVLLNSVSLVCAAEVDCPRCINNHQVHLIEHFGMDEAYVDEVLDFENSQQLRESDKAALRFARKVAFAEPLDEEDFSTLRSHGFSDLAAVEIVSMALLESSMARHAVGVAQFETGEDWPRDNVPSAHYAANVNA